MVYRPERWEYRLTLTDVDRGVNVDTTLVMSRHPSETTTHLVLRVLAYCLVYVPEIEFGPGVCIGDAPDLFANDLTGRLRLWVGCGDVAPDLAKRTVQHNRDAEVHIVFGRQADRDAFHSRVNAWSKRPRGWENLSIWTFPDAFVADLAADDHLRQTWTVTIAGDHMYLDAQGRNWEVPLERTRGTPA